jgi:HTH-type transcriptional regulator/antitoxin HigA
MVAKMRAADDDNIQTEPVMAFPARTRPKVGKRYMALFARFPIRPIRHEPEYDAAIKVLDELAVRDEQTLSSDERDYLGALVMLVEAYDAEHYRIDTSKLTPAERLKFLMEQRGMTFNDLVDVLGSKAAASYLLSGARAASRAQCFTLGEHFGVEPGMFLSPKSEPKHKSRPMSFVKH